MIDNGYQLIFLANRKTASVSIKVALRGDNHVNSPEIIANSCNHNTGPIVAESNPTEWEKYHKFTVVRNTWDRAHSFFYYHQKTASHRGRYADINFEQWIMKECRAPVEDEELFRKEGCWDDPLDQLRYTNFSDSVLVFERLDDQWKAFCLARDIPFNELPHKNDLNRNPPPWTSAMIDQLGERYSEEIKIFGFEPPNM